MWKYRFIAPSAKGPKISDAEMAAVSAAGTEVEAPFNVDTVCFDVERYEIHPDRSILKIHGLWGHNRLTKEDRIPGEIGLPVTEEADLRGRLDRLIFRSARFF